MHHTTLPYSLITQFDIDLFESGKHTQLYHKLGSHIITVDGRAGVYFAVYAPAAQKVQVIGDFNHWQGDQHALNVRWDGSGIWEGFIPTLGKGELYKYRIWSNHDHKVREKADPFARKYEMPPKSASIVWADNFKSKLRKWPKERKTINSLNSPQAIYEVHLGSWMKKAGEFRSMHYNELADTLVKYVVEMGFTHVEFMPVMEHPFYPSWGYLCTGYFAPSSRFGDTHDLKYLIDEFHRAGVGVYLDWVPAHFPSDEHALADFDGSALYEHPERAKGFHPDWNSLIFNYERPQVRSFLLSSAHFWMAEYQVDGLRVDAVASMLYLDYSREDGEWSPNMFGGNEYLAAIDFTKELNSEMYRDFDYGQMVAEESTAFPGVTNPVHDNGLGFGLKWMMGWMNDTLEYFQLDPIHRKYHHGEISRSLTYAFSENYVLPLSHDEVVHGKQSLISKMPGDDWQKFANLRLLYTYMYTHPGQKLLFMGGEIGQWEEWNVDDGVHWHLLDDDKHLGLQRLVKALNRVYTSEVALYGDNYSPSGFEWVDYSDAENSVLSFYRKSGDDNVLVILNFSPVVRDHYRVGVNSDQPLKVILNSDNLAYWGSDVNHPKLIKPQDHGSHGRQWSIQITLPPLAGIILKINE